MSKISGLSLPGGPGRSSGYAIPGSGAGGYTVPEWIPVPATNAVESDPNNYAVITEASSTWTWTIAAGLANQTLDGAVGSGVTRPPAIDVPILSLFPAFDPTTAPALLYVRLSSIVMPDKANNTRLMLGAGLVYTVAGAFNVAGRFFSMGPITTTAYSLVQMTNTAVWATQGVGASQPAWFTSYTATPWDNATPGVTGPYDTGTQGAVIQTVGTVLMIGGQTTGTGGITPTLADWYLRMAVGKRPSGVAVAGGEVLSAYAEVALMPSLQFFP